MESGMLDDFVERKHGRAEITYMFPELEPILKPTYGVIVYQEQVMQIVQTIGGFSLGGADLVRRAMGKKIKEEMDKLKDEFAEGAARKGFDRNKAEELFDLIVKFAGYGFNKSHSAAYAMVTFYTSFLKRYYPTEFMAALLTLEKDNTTKVVKYVDEVKRMGIRLLPPDINRSDLAFVADEIDGSDVILFGLGAIKGAGDIAINSFQQSKSITSGEGGAVVTNDAALFERAVRFHDVSALRAPYNEILGGGMLAGFAACNYRMSEFTGAVLKGQLQKLETLQFLQPLP